MLHKVLSRLNQQIAELNLAETQEIISGKAPDYTDYRRRCALIKGREQALAMLFDVAKQLDEDDGEF